MTTLQMLGEKAVYLVIDWSMIGTHRMEPLRSHWAQEAEADQGSVRLGKKTLESPLIDTIRRLHGEARRIVHRYGIPSLQEKRTVIPVKSVKAVEADLADVQARVAETQAALLDAIPTMLNNAQTRLGATYNPDDYHNLRNDIRSIQIGWRWCPIEAAPEILKSLAADVYERDLAKGRAAVSDEVDAMKQALRGALLQTIQSMRKTLMKPSGEKRAFGHRFFSRLNTFLDSFDAKQTLTEDGILGSIVDDLRRIAHGVDPTTLKDDNATQEALNVELHRISEVLEPLVAGDRQIDFAA